MMPLFFILFIIGACIGSFMNVVVLRYLSGETLGGRSHCPGCHRQLTWWELLPIVSWLALRGRCSHCQKPISVQYVLVELIMGVLAASLVQPLLIGIAACFVVLFLIDLYSFLLPDRFLLILSAVVVWYQLMTTGREGVPLALCGAALGAGLLFILWIVTEGRGIGLGDVKLMIPLGWLFGLWPTLFLLWLAFMAGGLISVVLLVGRRATMKTAVPFGPFLTGAALLLLLLPGLPELVFSFWVH